MKHDNPELRKIVIPYDKLDKLISMRTRLDTEIKRLEAKPAPLKKRRTQCDTLISRYVNKDNGIQNHTSEEGVMCYSSASDFYTIPPATREDTNAWVLEPCKTLVPKEVYDEMRNRIRLFKNECVKTFVDEYRLATGGQKVVTGKNTYRIEEGDLPDGINMFRDDKPNFRKTKTSK